MSWECHCCHKHLCKSGISKYVGEKGGLKWEKKRWNVFKLSQPKEGSFYRRRRQRCDAADLDKEWITSDFLTVFKLICLDCCNPLVLHQLLFVLMIGSTHTLVLETFKNIHCKGEGKGKTSTEFSLYSWFLTSIFFL